MTTSLRRLWARFLFQDRGIVPTKRLIYLISGLGLILFVISFFRFDLIIFASVIVSVVLLSMLDLLRSPNRKELAIRRVIPEQVERHQREKLSLIVTNRSDKQAQIKWIDDLPESVKTKRPELIELLASRELTIDQPIQASERGLFLLKKIYLRYQSQLGLWQKQITFELEDTIKVIPNLTE